MFFSIIIPTFNRAHMLPMALQSVLDQTFADWECIVVDDGSSDNTKQIVDVWVKIDTRVKYIYQINAERSVARNNGIRNSKGDFICFLDSDDSYHPNYLQELHDLVTNNNITKGFIITGLNVISGKNNYEELPAKNNYKNFSTYFFRQSITPSRVCVSAELFKSSSFDPETTISEDTKLWVELAANNCNVFFNNKAYVNFNIHDENTVNVSKRNVYYERKKTLKQIIKSEFGKTIDKIVAKKTLNDCDFGIHKHYILNKKHFKAFLVIFISILSYPSYRIKEKVYLLLKPFQK